MVETQNKSTQTTDIPCENVPVSESQNTEVPPVKLETFDKNTFSAIKGKTLGTAILAAIGIVLVSLVIAFILPVLFKMVASLPNLFWYICAVTVAIVLITMLVYRK